VQFILLIIFPYGRDDINCLMIMIKFLPTGLWGPAVALIGLSYTSADNIVLAVAMLTISVGINAGHYTGFMVSVQTYF
jgi:hypothetical protein